MDARLGELEVALASPSQTASLPALVMELSRLATSEAHATAARICMQLRHDNEAALLDAETRHGSLLEAQRKIVWEHQRALEAAQKHIEQLESEKHAVTQSARDQGQMLEVERAARAETDRSVALLERQLQLAAAQFDEVNTAARKQADEHARVYDEAAGLRAELEELSGQLTVEQSRAVVAAREHTDAADRIAGLQLELKQALLQVDAERQAAAREIDARDQAVARIAALESAFDDVQRQRDEATQTLAPHAAQHAALESQLADAVAAVNGVTAQLEAERVAATELRAELAAAQSARDAEREMVTTLQLAAADIDSVRGAHDEALRERDAERGRVADLDRAHTALRNQLESERATLSELTRRGKKSGGDRAALADELNRVMTAKAELEAALAEAQARASHNLTAEHEQRQATEHAVAEAGAARRDLATALQTLEAVEQARDAAQHAASGFQGKLSAIEHEHQALTALLDEEQARATALQGAAAEAETARRDLAQALEKLEAVERARDAAQRSVEGFEEQIAAIEQERQALASALDAEFARAADLQKSAAHAEAGQRDLEQALQKLEAVARARDDAQQTVNGFDKKVGAIEQERQALAAALDAERARAAELQKAVIETEQRLAEANAVAETLRLELLEAPEPAPMSVADDEEIELSFDEPDDQSAARPGGTSGVRVATRYSFASRIEIGVNGRTGQLVNLSVAGCGVRTSTPLEVGVSVIVQLPGESGAPCEGVVVWSRREGSRHTKLAHRSGVHFTKADVMAIEAFMILEAEV